jgi:hypothetical protein
MRLGPGGVRYRLWKPGGRDAVQASRSRPEGFEGHPKSRIDEGELLLGGRAVPVTAAIGAVLRRVHNEALHVAGAPIGRLVLTHPVSWGARRRQTLMESSAAAGLPPPILVAEPVAAASFYVYVLRHEVPLGGCLAVYDFGAGTFDASVVRRTAKGFEVLAAEGLDDTGGLDVDAAIVAHLGATYGAGNPEGWQRLTAPQDPADRRLARTFWDDVRAGKEALSRTAMATIFVPILELEAVLGREQLDHLARPLLERTVATTRLAVRNAGIRPEDIAAVFLVGGSSRMSLTPTLLHQSLGVAPTVIEQPELIVAGGTLCFHLAAQSTAPPMSPMSAPLPVSVPPAAPVSPFPMSVPLLPAAPVSPFPMSPAPPPAGQYQVPAPTPIPMSVPAPGGRPPGAWRRAVDSTSAATKMLTAAAVFVIVLATTLIVARPWGGSPDGAASSPSAGHRPTLAASSTTDLRAEAATKVAACELQHKMTNAKQSVDNGAGVRQFTTCEWPPSKLADADGYWEIIVNSDKGPGDSAASGMNAADRVTGPCQTFEVTYDYGSMGASRHLSPFKVPRGAIWITTYNGGEQWTGDRSTIPFYPDRDEAVILTSDHYGLVDVACA